MESSFRQTEPVPGLPTLPKSPTGIVGLDQITFGGLPTGRPTLFCGNAGCGKTLFGMEFLIHGALDYDEPGVFVAFEETAEDLTQNVRSLGYDLDELQAQNKLYLEHIHIDRSEIDEAGEYDLDGLFIRLALAIDSIGAKRIVLDTLETLFSGFDNAAILRAELRRLFLWLKERGITAVITAERGGDGFTLTRQGLEEYVSDCVILLDHRVNDQVSTRRLRVVKYRGTVHGTNEYPFLIGSDGINVLPITSLALNHAVSEERVSSGVPRLDTMLGGKGFYRGSSILVSGTPGTGKTSLSGHFADAACRRGERVLYFAFEESPRQICRNLTSIGLNLQQWVDGGLLQFHAARPTLYGLETHLAVMHQLIEKFDPHSIIVDPISNFIGAGTQSEAQAMLLRLIDFLKTRGTTAFFVNLVGGGQSQEQTEIAVSSIVDTWLLLRDIELGGERNRGIYILKSRGMAHSNQIREFLLTNHGIELQDVYVGPEGVLTGSMRSAQEARERAEELDRTAELERQRRQRDRKRQALLAQIAVLQSELEDESQHADEAARREQMLQDQAVTVRAAMARSRKADEMNGDIGGEK
ncbi:circadian clock protein KaiC [Planctomicrobium piriforme]